MSVTVLDSFADAVDENYTPELDGFDGADPAERKDGLLARALYSVSHRASASSRSKAASIVVPYPDGVGEGDRSNQVYAVKRAYARSVSGWRLRSLMAKPLEVRETWGALFSDEFGQRYYSKTRHAMLAPYFDAYALSLLPPVVSARDKQIALQVGWHNELYNRRYQVPYSQLRPSQIVAASRVTRADCSGSVAGGCAWAGIHPRIDWRYTNTWIQDTPTFGALVPDIARAKRGDVIFYGSPSHEALYLGDGLVWSFGSYPARILRHDYRHDRHSIRRFVPL